MALPSNSAPAPRPAQVLPSGSVRRILATMQQVAGSQYAPLLRSSGAHWQPYVEQLPPDTATPSGVTEDDLSSLYGTLHRMLGVTLTRSFLSTYGRAMGARMVEHPGFAQLKAEVDAAPASEKLATAVRVMADDCTRNWTPLRGWDDQQYVYLELDHCPVCARMEGAREPMCAGSEAIYTHMVRTLTGVRVTFQEVECVARGAPHCRFRASK